MKLRGQAPTTRFGCLCTSEAQHYNATLDGLHPHPASRLATPSPGPSHPRRNSSRSGAGRLTLHGPLALDQETLQASLPRKSHPRRFSTKPFSKHTRLDLTKLTFEAEQNVCDNKCFNERSEANTTEAPQTDRLTRFHQEHVPTTICDREASHALHQQQKPGAPHQSDHLRIDFP